MKIKLIENGIAFIRGLRRRDRGILCAIVLIVSAVVFDRIVIQWASGRSRELDESIEKAQIRIRKDIRIMGLKNSLKRQVPGLQRISSETRSEDEEMTFLLKEIEKIAADCGVYLVDMKPGGAEGAVPGTKYLVNLNLEGGMDSLAQFMYKVETHESLFTIEKYDVAPKSREHSMVKASVTVSNLVVP